MWSGLLTFTAFVVWGVTGINAVFLPAPDQYKPPEISREHEFAFEAPGNLDDKELANRIFDAADLKMAGGHYNVHRDDDHHLKFFVFTPNGRRDLTYLEDEKRVRIQFRATGLTGFLSVMHAAHSRRGAPTSRRASTASTTNSRHGLFSSCRYPASTCGSRHDQGCPGRESAWV